MNKLNIITGAAAGTTIALSLIGYVQNIVNGHELIALIGGVAAALILIDYIEGNRE